MFVCLPVSSPNPKSNPNPNSATLRANAVEKMRHKCEQKTATAVSLATLQLSRDLTISQRVEAVLHSKLAKTEVHLLIYLTLTLPLYLPLPLTQTLNVILRSRITSLHPASL